VQLDALVQVLQCAEQAVQLRLVVGVHAVDSYEPAPQAAVHAIQTVSLVPEQPPVL
jgi:hypothetical protein